MLGKRATACTNAYFAFEVTLARRRLSCFALVQTTTPTFPHGTLSYTLL